MQNKHYFFFSFLGIPTFGEWGGVKPVGPKSQLLPKICFACFPKSPDQTVQCFSSLVISGEEENRVHLDLIFLSAVNQNNKTLNRSILHGIIVCIYHASRSAASDHIEDETILSKTDIKSIT